MPRAHYHTLEHYLDSGLRSFIDNTVRYFQGVSTIPVGRTNQEKTKRYIYFTFSNDLLAKFMTDLASVKKAYEVAIKYGFRGHSTGQKNGIFFVRKEDKGLLRAFQGLASTSENSIVQDLEVSPDEVRLLKKVKIVCHDPSGKRIVGLFNTKNNRIIFLGFAQY